MRKRNPEKRLAKLKADYEVCVQAMIKSNFNRTKAAKILNIERRTLYNKFKAFEEAGLHVTQEVI
jgi:two-component system response regulator HydG